jgi:quinol monooxygenase YgiN
MSEFIFVNRLQAKDGHREELIELLREFAVSMHAEPGCVHYSIHEPVEDETGLLTVIQAYSSIEAFQEHAAWMGPNVPRLAALLESPPQPPALLQQVPLSGDVKESLSAA